MRPFQTGVKTRAILRNKAGSRRRACRFVFESHEHRGDENLRKMPNSGQTVRAARQEDGGCWAQETLGQALSLAIMAAPANVRMKAA
jgi:hypothetical protein